MMYPGSVGIAILAGKITLGQVEYRTKNVCVIVMRTSIALCWWAKSVRHPKHSCLSPQQRMCVCVYVCMCV